MSNDCPLSPPWYDSTRLAAAVADQRRRCGWVRADRRARARRQRGRLRLPVVLDARRRRPRAVARDGCNCRAQVEVVGRVAAGCGEVPGGGHRDRRERKFGGAARVGAGRVVVRARAPRRRSKGRASKKVTELELASREMRRTTPVVVRPDKICWRETERDTITAPRSGLINAHTPRLTLSLARRSTRSRRPSPPARTSPGTALLLPLGLARDRQARRPALVLQVLLRVQNAEIRSRARHCPPTPTPRSRCRTARCRRRTKRACFGCSSSPIFEHESPDHEAVVAGRAPART